MVPWAMPEDALPADVARFVLDWLPSVVHLEALLLLHAHSDEELSAEMVSRGLYVSASAALGALNDLVADRLASAASPDGPFRYAPDTPERHAEVSRVAEVHRTRLVPLSRFIHEHERSRSAHEFANAFRLRKD